MTTQKDQLALLIAVSDLLEDQAASLVNRGLIVNFPGECVHLIEVRSANASMFVLWRPATKSRGYTSMQLTNGDHPTLPLSAIWLSQHMSLFGMPRGFKVEVRDHYKYVARLVKECIALPAVPRRDGVKAFVDDVRRLAAKITAGFRSRSS